MAITLLAILYGVLCVLSLVPSKVSEYVLPAALVLLTLEALGVFPA